MNRLLLGLARFCLASWCGGAILFVLVTVTEIRSGVLESMLLDQIVLLRFPMYYRFTFVLLPTAGITLAGLAWQRRLTRAGLLAMICTGLALSILVVDYFSFYLSLREMLLPIGSPRPATFHWYHRATEWANTAALVCGLIAAGLLSGTMSFLPPAVRADSPTQ